MHWCRILSQRRSPHSASTLQARPTKSTGPASTLPPPPPPLRGQPVSANAHTKSEESRRVRFISALPTDEEERPRLLSNSLCEGKRICHKPAALWGEPERHELR